MSGSLDTKSGKKAIIVCTWDWYYYSHRRSIARMLIKAGYEVIVVTRIFEHREPIEADGVRIIELPFSRPSLNPFREYRISKQLRRIYQAEQPDLVFHIAFKPVLYGSLAASKLDVPVQVNAIAGMGQLFLGTSLKIRLIRSFVLFLLKRAFRNPATRLIVQNNRDFQFLKERLQIPDSRIFLIKGVGVDLNQFTPDKHLRDPADPPVISMVSRLIKEKGVVELVEAARIMKSRNLRFEIRLVGDPDFDSPEQISREQLEAWQAEGLIVWTGFSDDIQRVYSESDIAVLPSYSEGLPKSLLEACACGLPIVTTDNAGCVEVVDQNRNGLIVPVKDPEALAKALEQLIVDRDLRCEFGHQSRLKAEAEFDLKAILQSTGTVCDLDAEQIGELGA